MAGDVEAAAAPSGKASDARGDLSSEAVWLTIVLNLGLLTVNLVLFGLFVNRRTFSSVLAPLLRDFESRPNCTPWGWAVKAWKRRKEVYSVNIDGAVVLRRKRRDIDGIVVLRLCMLGFKISVTGMLISIIMMPVYMRDSSDMSSLLSSGVVPIGKKLHGNNVLAITTVVAAYGMVVILLYYIREEWKFFVHSREQHFERLVRCEGQGGASAAQAMRSIRVEGIPREYRSIGVRQFFEDLMPGDGIHSCVRNPNTWAFYNHPAKLLRGPGQQELDALRHSVADEFVEMDECFGNSEVAEKYRCFLSLDQPVLERNQVTMGKERTPSKEAAGKAAATLAAVCSSGQNLKEQMDGAVRRTEEVSRARSYTAFITFDTVTERVLAEQAVISHTKGWTVTAATEACDIIWRNASYSRESLHVRKSLAGIVVMLGLVFWSVPVLFIQACGRMFQDNVPAAWAESPITRSGVEIIGKYLPVVALIGLQSTIPQICAFMSAYYERYRTKSEIALSVMHRNIRFQLATLCVIVLSSSTFDSVIQVFNQPAYFLDILEKEIPIVAIFFMKYAMTKATLTLPVLLWQPLKNLPSSRLPRCLQGRLGRFFPKEKKDMRPEIGKQVSELSMVLILALTYSVIAPPLLLICAFYFLLAWVIYNWLFLYVYTPESDCFGAFWYEFYSGIMKGLMLGTLSLAAIVGRHQRIEFYALLFLCLLVLAAHLYFKRRWMEPSKFLSLEDASAIDRAYGSDQMVGSAAVKYHAASDYYLDPMLHPEAAGFEEEKKKDASAIGGACGAARASGAVAQCMVKEKRDEEETLQQKVEAEIRMRVDAEVLVAEKGWKAREPVSSAPREEEDEESEAEEEEERHTFSVVPVGFTLEPRGAKKRTSSSCGSGAVGCEVTCWMAPVLRWWFHRDRTKNRY